MNIFGRSMNESKFHLVLFKPSTHLFQWSEITLGPSAKAICRMQGVKFKFSPNHSPEK